MIKSGFERCNENKHRARKMRERKDARLFDNYMRRNAALESAKELQARINKIKAEIAFDSLIYDYRADAKPERVTLRSRLTTWWAHNVHY